MKVTNRIDQESVSGAGSPGIGVLSNGRGGFSVLSPVASSRYEGVFVKRRLGQVFRFLESIEQKDPVVEVVNRLWCLERKRRSCTETLIMPQGHDALIIQCSQPATMRLVVDCKAAYDNREWGRQYSVVPLPHGAVVSFSKRNDARDPASPFGEYDQGMAVYAPGGEFKPVASWQRRVYVQDQHRNSPPFERFVFVPGEVRAKEMVLGFGFSKAMAVANAVRVWNRKGRIVREEKARAVQWGHQLAQVPERVDVAYACAAHALDSLIVDQVDLYAGLPWFFQYWSRDSAVSSRALVLTGRRDIAKSILLGHAAHVVNPSGFATRKGGFHEPWSVPLSFDGILWAFARIGELMDEDSSFFSRQEQERIAQAVPSIVERVQSVMKDGLVLNGPKETWMDTEWRGDDRAGARIEMQALALRVLQLAGSFGVHAPLDRCAAQVKKSFWNGKYLHDGVLVDGTPDATIRPNLFIAAYVYPGLLSTREWKACMEAVLPKLWLEWGGLASIATSHPLFTADCTGEEVKSYHRGDSWFWINNMAALVLHRLDKVRFRPYISKILDASTRELLFEGAVGHHAEISSASHLSSEGCLSQAWSNALYIELLTELFGPRRGALR